MAVAEQVGIVQKPNGKRPPRSYDLSETTNGIAAVDCCRITVTGNSQRFVCKYPGCAREYASRDAVRKHCRIRHLTWLRGLVRTSAREVEVIPQQPTDSPLGSLLSPLLTPTLGPCSPPTLAMGSLELHSVPPLELNPSSPEEEAPGFDALVNGGYLLSALSTLSTLAVAAHGKPEIGSALRVPISAA
eukprot:CAMPEP_0119059344 /NCGR_PEP_ID=MMETSP1178-20130426/3518_1 /TAXON_ID=33656 /ORGANISM="unid sp, Strain CCMP2000" /LENGTH=187 /DNA_ID=CAMNT_0007040375 /DNA_START=86 /DNA_END=649 /DNA_ORIENTATION=+